MLFLYIYEKIFEWRRSISDKTIQTGKFLSVITQYLIIFTLSLYGKA